MTLFTKRFIKRMGIFSAILYILNDVIVKMTITGARIKFETVNSPVYVTFILSALIVSGVIAWLAIVFTRDLRCSSIYHFPKSEYKFYTVYFIFYSLIPIAYAFYIYHYSLPFYAEALREAINGVYIYRYEESYFKKLSGQLTDIHDSRLLAEKIALAIGCVIHITVYRISMLKLIKVYQDPFKKPKRRI
ncbi:hypothetical protein [Ruminococcus sp.]|uniref:hypothetical protein n=1 Tax=Ruminococcus sp. TaxID=41978 RepID=UPI0025EA2C3A|nr:hypothetical protein [Ruminococcus sp.]MBQ8967636.1 hypothetical protein [Ruminococcus sp.]